ncbi:regulating synaptic membrane exocytosis protein fife isoform X2 [Calliopsis andreniformis]|uniref:regulating synaptic membrane exocytosis protein fife isoform X2 n=1 Tax=Calliopsis andreniformis TaxID=337506 RepID=UPI003FCC726C
MLPANVVSFVKKMVTAQPDSGTTGPVTPDDGGTTFSKWKQIGSDVIRDVAKLGPAKVTPPEETQPKEETTTETTKTKSKTGDDCRVCRKSFAPEEASRICCECQQKVCEDCACYSTTTNSDDPSSWRCSVCRRKIASRDHPIVMQESTDSLLEVPILETLQRRHSDARLGCQSGSQIGGLGSGLAPPRSPELRRHSDVSPASLKELEKFRKVAGERREDLRWERDLERKSKSRATSPDRHQVDRARATSPQRVAVEPASVTAEAPEAVAINVDEDEERRRRTRRSSTVRVKTRMTRQRSCDDEMKNVTGMSGSGGTHTLPNPGLGIPPQLPRRASAYDVYATPGVGELNAMAIAAAQQRVPISPQGGRKPEERSTIRRPSFRAVKPVMPYEVGGEDESMMKLETAVPVVPPVVAPVAPAVVPQSVVVPDEERRTRRRGSQLPDINAIKALTSVAPVAAKVVPPTVVNRVAAEDRELARQGSLVDGESIKIVIHHADNDMTPWVNAKRRIKLRRDPTLDKGHRTAGFGLRVVGGKTGSDGRTFAYVMWTVPDGPAAKAAIQRGDKVLEWGGVSLVDRSFEEVAQITERGDEVIELVIEHVGDTGDLPDDIGTVPAPGKPPGNMGMLMEAETDKTPSSPTRRKLPKTPEQIAKEKQVTGRIQIQVSYEADRKELIVSVFMADDLCPREDTGYGTLPEAYAKLVLMPICTDQTTLKTAVAEPSQKPIWNATLLFSGVDGESLMKRAIEVTLWDFCPNADNVFLGECTVELQRALENDRAVWYRLEDPRGIRVNKSPRGSLSMEAVQRLRKTELHERSYSDDTQSDSGSPEFGFLHPDHAWHGSTRRGSSQSEQFEAEPYELSRNYSRSLPGSRRSSFQGQGGTDSKRGSMGEADIIVHYYGGRRRSSFTRPPRDPEEIREGLQSLKAAQRELGRTMSLSGDKRPCVVPTVTVWQCEPVSPRTGNSASFSLPHSIPPR